MRYVNSLVRGALLLLMNSNDRVSPPFKAARNDGILNPCLDHVTDATEKMCAAFEAADLVSSMGR